MTFFSLLKKYRLRKKTTSSQEKLPPPLEAILKSDQDVPPPIPTKQKDLTPVLEETPPQIVSQHSSSDIRHLSKLAAGDEEQGAPAHRPAVYKEALEDASTGAMPSFASAGELPKKSTFSSLKKEYLRLQTLIGSRWKKVVSSDRKQHAENIVSKVKYELSSLKKTSPQRDSLILRPGENESGWQLWKFPNKKEELPCLIEDHASPFYPSQTTRLVVGVPTRDLIVIPLWISTEGNRQELLELELSSKHLLRRGMMESLKTIPLETEENRILIVVLTPTSSPSIATAPYLKAADQFEAAARLLPHQDADLLVWRELGEVCFGFLRKNQYVWFSGSNETTVTPATLSLIKRITLRLEAESILPKTPQSLHVFGSFSEEERSLLKSLIGMSSTALDSKKYVYYSELPQPLLSTPQLDLPDEAARTERLHQEKKLRLKKGIALIVFIYICLLLLASGALFLKKSTLSYLLYRITKERPAIEQANQTITQWQEFRPAIDPTAYPLDILAKIAAQIHGEKIRLITLAGMDGKLQIIGEATDVAQAYHFIEQIKKTPELQEYEWTSGQPKLAGKSSVRFELEGSRSHAKTST
jgi:hypothetical protein